MTHFSPLTQNFVQSIISSLDSKDPVVANAWLDTLLDVIDLLPREVMSNEVLSIAVTKSHISQPTSSRLGACQLIGKLGTKFNHHVIETELLPIAQSLSQDTEWTVRASICTQLLLLLKGLSHSGGEDRKSPTKNILAMIIKLSNDEQEAVRLVAIETISAMLPLLDNEACTLVILPLLKKISERAARVEDKTLPLLAQNWAKICHCLQTFMSNNDKEWFVQFYYGMATLGMNQQSKLEKNPMPDVVAHVGSATKLEIYADVRHSCAANCAAMATFIGAEEFSSKVVVLHSLSADPHYLVRCALSSNLLDLCRHMGHFGKIIHPIWNQLLVDPFSDVTCTLVTQIGATIEHFTRLGPHSPFSEESVIQNTCEAILRCEEHVMNCSSWRLQADMLSQLAALPLCLPCNVVHDLLVPRLWYRIETLRPLPCRIIAAQTLMLCVRSEQRNRENAELCQNIVGRLILSSSCHYRMLFLRVCPVLFDVLTRKFFRQHFFTPLIQLAEDKVPNVRLRFCSLLPNLHSCLRGLDIKTERHLIVALDSAVRRLVETECDQDVKQELRKFFLWVDGEERKDKGLDEDKEEEDQRKGQETYRESVVIKCDASEDSSRDSKCLPYFIEFDENQPKEISAPVEPTANEKSESLDPTTDEFYRDAGVRLSSTPMSLPKMKNLTQAEGSRIPSFQLRKVVSEKVDALPPNKIRQPSNSSVRNQNILPHFGIARGVQQVHPKPNMAYVVSIASPGSIPPVRIQRRNTSSLNSVKSRSQENLTLPPKPKPTRPISACLGGDFITNKTTFSRNKFRASIGSMPTKGTGIPLPVSTLTQKNNLETKTSDGRVPNISRKHERNIQLSNILTPKPYGSALSKMSDSDLRKITESQSPLAMTPVVPRKQSTSNENQLSPQVTRKLSTTPKKQSPFSPKKVATTAMEKKLDEAAAEMLAALQSTTCSKPTKLRKPSVTNANAKLVASVSSEGVTTSGSCPSSPQNSRANSPERSFQRRSQWRRSANFGTAATNPPPPPPRRSFGALPHFKSINNNNSSSNSNSSSSSNSSANNNNSSTITSKQSKLPVPALKRNIDLGVEF